MLVYLFSACQAPPTPTSIPATETPLPTALSLGTPVIIQFPVRLPVLLTSTPKFATFCDAVAESTQMAAQCHRPIAEQGSVFCENKVPYNLISMNQSASYQVLDERFHCSEAGTKDGKKQVTCTGPMGQTFEVKVCDPACALPVYSSVVTYCPQEYIFDSQRSCCARELPPDDYNCVLLRLDSKKCTINCREFTGQAACYGYFYSCEWDDENYLCRPRK